jgi:hypothetical protein
MRHVLVGVALALVLTASEAVRAGPPENPTQVHDKCRLKVIEVFANHPDVVAAEGNFWKSIQAIDYLRACMRTEGYLLKDSCLFKNCDGAAITPFCFYLDTPSNRKRYYGAAPPDRCKSWQP